MSAVSEPTAYRPCVGVMLLNSEGKVFVGQRIDARDNDPTADWWQMPQGGVDPGENMEEAAYRELHEETGITAVHAQIITKTHEPIQYDLPPNLMGRLWNGEFRGQEQIWFLMRFTGSDSDVNLNAHDPAEFCKWKWAEAEMLPALIIPFKKPVYETILNAFRGEI